MLDDFGIACKRGKAIIFCKLTSLSMLAWLTIVVFEQIMLLEKNCIKILVLLFLNK